jgi:hypothetical protein
MLLKAKKYHAYARECLQLAEQANKPEVRQSLIELSRVWMEVALEEEKHHLNGIGSGEPESSQSCPGLGSKRH